MIEKFDREKTVVQLLKEICDASQEKLTIDDVGMEAVRLNYDELDLRLVPDDVQAQLPFWMIVYMMGIDDLVGYALVDDEQTVLYAMGVLRDGQLLSKGGF